MNDATATMTAVREPAEAEVQTSHVASAPSERPEWPWRDLLGSFLIALLLLVQYGLFRQYALREIVWSYPTQGDQNEYLGRAYDAYERFLEDGWQLGLRETMGFRKVRTSGPQPIFFPPHPRDSRAISLSPNGAMIQVQAGALMLVLGPGRLTALTLNFIYYAILQIALVATLRWLSGRWSVALIGLGLLLTAIAPFYTSGDLMDFRIDFIAFCLFGTFICLVIRSGVFANLKWSAIAGAAGGMLIAFRFISASYVAMIMSMMLVFLAFRYWFVRRDSLRRRPALRQLGGALLCGIVIDLIAGPLILHHWKAIKEYYLRSHLNSADVQTRALSQGINSIWEHLWYYPRTIYENHLGETFVIRAAAIVAVALLIWCIRLVLRGRGSGARRGLPRAWVFLSCCIIVPLVVLNLDRDKSPVIGSIFVTPTVLLVLMSAVAMVGAFRGDMGSNSAPQFARAVEWGLGIGAVLVLSAGINVQLARYTARGPLQQSRRSIEAVLVMYDAMAKACNAMELRNPIIACDRQCDYLHSRIFRNMAFERQGRLLDVGESLALVIQAVSFERAQAAYEQSDFVILTTEPPPPPGAFEYPFNRSMREMEPELRQYCEQNFVRLTQAQGFGVTMTVYMRPMVRLQDVLGPGRFTVSALPAALRARPIIQLKGPLQGGDGGAVPHLTAQISRPGNFDHEIPVDLDVHDGQYMITLHLEPRELDGEDAVRVVLRQTDAQAADGTRSLILAPSEGYLLDPSRANRAGKDH